MLRLTYVFTISFNLYLFFFLSTVIFTFLFFHNHTCSKRKKRNRISQAEFYEAISSEKDGKADPEADGEGLEDPSLVHGLLVVEGLVSLDFFPRHIQHLNLLLCLWGIIKFEVGILSGSIGAHLYEMGFKYIFLTDSYCYATLKFLQYVKTKSFTTTATSSTYNSNNNNNNNNDNNNNR